MSTLGYLLIGFFLPLFPFSIGFNALLTRVTNLPLRLILLLAWPQIGLLLLAQTDGAPPAWIVTWAMATSLLYSLRLLAVRELGRWIAFLATAAWGLLWLLPAAQAALHALWFSLPLLLLALLTASLERRFGGAYTGIYQGLAQAMPRFSAVLVITVLAAVATPPAPTFFSMLSAFLNATPGLMSGLVAVWLLWTWAAARLLQGLIVGPGTCEAAVDLERAGAWTYTAALLTLVVGGAVFSGGVA